MNIINVNYDNIESINKAEQLKETLENRGFKLIGTIQTGFNKFALKYKRTW